VQGMVGAGAGKISQTSAGMGMLKFCGCGAQNFNLRRFFCDFQLATFWFLSHHFGSRYARKSIKGSRNSDDSLEFRIT